MKQTILAGVVLALAGAAPASAAPGLGVAGAVYAVSRDGAVHVACSFDRDLEGVVSFRGAMTPGAGQFWMSCSVASGGVKLTAYGNVTASGKGVLPAGPVTICASGTLAQFVGSSHADGCATW